jgi:hypothetical protein
LNLKYLFNTKKLCTDQKTSPFVYDDHHIKIPGTICLDLLKLQPKLMQRIGQKICCTLIKLNNASRYNGLFQRFRFEIYQKTLSKKYCFILVRLALLFTV